MICPICGHRPHPGFACNIPESVGNGDSYTLCECPFEDRRQPEPAPTLFDGEAPGFDAGESARLRDEAIQRVDDAAHEAWKARADLVVVLVARTLPEFTTDEVWQAMAAFPEKTHEPRAMGPVMLRAERDGYIVKVTGVFRPTVRAAAHRNPKQLYRSRIKETW